MRKKMMTLEDIDVMARSIIEGIILQINNMKNDKGLHEIDILNHLLNISLNVDDIYSEVLEESLMPHISIDEAKKFRRGSLLKGEKNN